MALIMNATHQEFNLAHIGRGDCIRVRRAGDAAARNGFVTEAAPDRLRILYCNAQNNATSYSDIKAADVAIGAWEVWWTRDFQTINYENNAPCTEQAAEG